MKTACPRFPISPKFRSNWVQAVCDFRPLTCAVLQRLYWQIGGISVPDICLRLWVLTQGMQWKMISWSGATVEMLRRESRLAENVGFAVDSVTLAESNHATQAEYRCRIATEWQSPWS
jgi:hypothetical protein